MIQKMNLLESKKPSRVLKYIREQLNKSYDELSDELGFNWKKAENNEIIISEEQARDIYVNISLDKNDLCKALFGTNEGFFHGSKNGIKGDVSISKGRDKVDFGKGFYVGDNLLQVATLCVSAEKPIVYRCSIDFDKLRTYKFSSSENWALYIAVNRRVINVATNKKLHNYYLNLCTGYDLIVGPIADDSLLSSFYKYCDINSTLTLGDLVRILTMVKLGNQYVFKTEKSLKRLKFEESVELVDNDKQIFVALSRDNYSYGKLASSMLGRSKKGKTFKDILKEWR